MRAIHVRDARHFRTGAAFELICAGGVIVATGEDAVAWRASSAAAAFEIETLDASGAVLAPGLVDVHVHLREPGQSAKETIATGTLAAAAGGFTSILCMPNTNPVVDTPAGVEWVLQRAKAAGHCRVLPIAATTVGQQGEQLTEFLALRDAGAVALSDDGHPVMSAAVMRHALEYATHAGLAIIGHEEDLTLRGSGQMNEGAVATRLGYAGIPNVAESVMVRRDCDLAALTGGRVHFAHLSCAESLDALRDGKRRGLAVTGETCPHYWTLTEDAVIEFGTQAKMNPPLRTESDRKAVIEAIVDGTLDCFATDHAPHTALEKDQPFDAAPNGIVGLETAFALTLTHLVRPGHITLARALELWTDAPRRIFALPPVELVAGFPADLVLIDPDEVWEVDPQAFESKGRNTPFAGGRLTGRVQVTICEGRITHARPEAATSGGSRATVPAGAAG